MGQCMGNVQQQKKMKSVCFLFVRAFVCVASWLSVYASICCHILSVYIFLFSMCFGMDV